MGIKRQKTIYRHDLARAIENVTPYGYIGNIKNGKAMKIVNHILDAIVKGVVENDKVVIPDFGTFYKKYVGSRVNYRPINGKGRKPRNEPVVMPARVTVGFRLGRGLRRDGRDPYGD